MLFVYASFLPSYLAFVLTPSWKSPLYVRKGSSPHAENCSRNLYNRLCTTCGRLCTTFSPKNQFFLRGGGCGHENPNSSRNHCLGSALMSIVWASFVRVHLSMTATRPLLHQILMSLLSQEPRVIPSISEAENFQPLASPRGLRSLFSPLPTLWLAGQLVELSLIHI